MLAFSKTKNQFENRTKDNSTMSNTVVEFRNITKLGDTQAPLRQHLPDDVSKQSFAMHLLTFFRIF